MRRLLALLLVAAAAGAAGTMLSHASPHVAFMGDSLTYGWSFPQVNYGLRGQTTAEMAERFNGQIAGQGDREVVILGGNNDTLLGIPAEATVDNLRRMVEMARAAGTEPVLAEIPPIYKENGRYLAATANLNARIVQLARARHVKLIDYYGALLGHPEAYSDGTHLKRRGYLRMEWALLRAIFPF